jgi:lipopolysaccharide export system protein LptA
VRVEQLVSNQVQGTMDCARLSAGFTGTNQLQYLLAQTNVLIRQQENQFAAGQGLFTASNSVLKLTERPSWQAGERSGRGETILVDRARDQMSVLGNASMRMPAGELGGLTALRVPEKTKAPTIPTNQTAEIFSEEYFLTRKQAQFRGGVYISHPRLVWSCETMTADLPASGGRMDHIVSDDKVTFDLADEKGQKVHGTGNQAVYQATYTGGITNESITLKGSPSRLLSITPAGLTNTLRSPVLLLDLSRHKFIVPPGDWVVRGTTPAPQTNAFHMPERGKKPKRFLKP